MPAISADDFLLHLEASGLLRADAAKAAVAALPRADRESGPGIAAGLVRAGKLTLFQARKLLNGASKGMALGPYRILAPLGHGGMGKVYLAHDTRAGRPVALKVLPPHRARTEERLLARFRQEMDVCRQVEHAHIARAFEAGVEGDVYYIAMEFVPGTTLAKAVREKGALAPDIAARVFVEAADGLAHAHARGIIHRDVKPSNIMITPAGHAKLLDLGLALRRDEASQLAGDGKKYVVGTMDYIAPEQTRDADAVDARSDLYGLGASLFFALTGRPPFPGGTSRDKMARQREERPPRVDEYHLDVPEGLANLIDELLAKEPADRPQSAKGVRDRLKQWSALPAPPDPPGVTAKILESLSTDPRTAEESSEEEVESAHDEPRSWAKYWVIAGAMALVAAAIVWWLLS